MNLERELLGGDVAIAWLEGQLKTRQDDATPAKRIIDWQGFRIGIQYYPLEIRHGRILMAGYGHIQKAKGADGRALDVYVGVRLSSPRVFAIAQLIDGKFNEEKLVIGADSLAEAQEIYLAAKPPEMFGGIKEISLQQLTDYRVDSFVAPHPAPRDKEQIRKDYALGLIARNDALQMLGYSLSYPEEETEGLVPNLPPQQPTLPYFWEEGEDIPEDVSAIAINYQEGGVLAIGFDSEEAAIAAFEQEYPEAEIETYGDVTDLLTERLDGYYLDAKLKNVKGNLCRDGRGRFTSCGKPVTKVESGLAKKRRELKEARAKGLIPPAKKKGGKSEDEELNQLLGNVKKSDHKQLQRLGELFVNKHIKASKPSPEELSLKKKIEKLGDEFEEYIKKGEMSPTSLHDRFDTASQEYHKIRGEREKALDAQISEIADRIKEKHGLSAKDLRAISNNVKIDQKTLGTINNVEAVKNMYEDFLALSGGKSSGTLKKIWKDPKAPRAYAGEKDINLGKMDNASNVRQRLYHEAAHHLERENPDLVKASNDWMRSRATGKAQKLKDLTGIKEYRDDEIALPDKYINPYVGKVYTSGLTEVLSVGMEKFSRPSTLRDFYESDPEHFNFVVGVFLAK